MILSTEYLRQLQGDLRNFQAKTVRHLERRAP